MDLSDFLTGSMLLFACVFIILELTQKVLIFFNKKKDLSSFTGIAALLSVVSGLYLGYNEYQELYKHGILTNGKITFVGFEDIDYSYFVNGVKYKWTQSETGYHTLQEGEVFKVLYHPNRPSTSKMLISQPVLRGNFEETYLKEFIWIEEEMVKFTYEVSGRNYVRIHFFPDKVKIDENKKYLVKYRLDNPQIAYIFLDEWEE